MIDKQKLAPLVRFRGYSNAWEQRKLGDFYFFKNGLNKEKEFFGTGTPIVNFVDVFNNRGILSSNLTGKVTLSDNEIMRYAVQQGDLFFTRTSETIDEIGYPAVMMDSPKDTVFSGFVLRGRALSVDPLVPTFKKYVFFTKNFRLEMIRKSSMTTRALTSGSALKEMNFKFPVNKHEQNDVGYFFDKLDTTITLHQRKLELLKRMKQGYLQQMFPQKDEEVPKMRVMGFGANWMKTKLGEVATIVGGGTPDTTNSTYWDGTIDWYSPAEIGKQIYVSKSTKQITELGLKKSSAKVLPIGTVLFTSRAGIGNTAILAKSGTTNQGFQSIVPIVEKLEPYFIYSQTYKLKRYGEKIGAGSTFIEVSGKQMTEMPLLIPEFDEQSKISDFFKMLDNMITLYQNKLKKLQTLKDSYLQLMFI